MNVFGSGNEKARTLEVFHPALYGSPAFQIRVANVTLRAALASDAVGDIRSDVLSLPHFFSIQVSHFRVILRLEILSWA